MAVARDWVWLRVFARRDGDGRGERARPLQTHALLGAEDAQGGGFGELFGGAVDAHIPQRYYWAADGEIVVGPLSQQDDLHGYTP